ncbi:hypothetical protein C8R47DRAFT_1324190 [Mycena vitilis]|nr:hypothetical protein C8R47DRAFT_1324190 [Mycena vitilis]
MRFAITLLALASAAVAQSSSGSAASSASSAASSVSASKSSASESKSSVASSISSAISAGISSGSAAQASATAIAALSPCALTCITAAASASDCQTPANVTCLCTNADFQQKSGSCLTLECQASEVGAAIGLQQSQCGAASLSVSGKPSATAPFTPSNSAADISGSASGASGSASGSTGSAAPLFIGNGVIVAGVVAAVGGFVGAFLV